jgi:hypothetical protein
VVTAGNNRLAADRQRGWADSRDRVAEAISARRLDADLIDEISNADRAIDPSMAWELAPGRVAQHAFGGQPRATSRGSTKRG